jgi:hypothetical protein
LAVSLLVLPSWNELLLKKPLNDRRFLWILLPCIVLLSLAAWYRGAEYDEQYTLFLTAGAPRPDWPETVFAAGLAADLQAGRSGFVDIARDLRTTDVHPPLYFCLVFLWRLILGPGLWVARLCSVAAGLGVLALTGVIARAVRIPAARAMSLTLGCYAFTYTCVIARGFALAELLLLGGVACLLLGCRTRHFALGGVLFGAATLTNYLAVFVAASCLFALSLQARGKIHRVLAAWAGFLVFIPADLWWFLAQRGSRDGQFPPFELLPSVARLAGRIAGAVLGALPRYVDGTASSMLTFGLGFLLVGLSGCVLWRWRRIGTRRTRMMFALAAAATPVGLLVLGMIFDNTPIELRYLAFSTPFIALLLAGAVGPRLLSVLLVVQAASIMGLILAPRTMQPAHATARAAAALVGDGVVLLPRGNDGVGIVGAFAIEAPPALPLLVIRGGETPDAIRARIKGIHRIVLALMEQDNQSRAAADAMRQALTDPHWREVARTPEVAVYDRLGGGE